MTLLEVPTDRYITRAELARIMGVHVTTIDRFRKEGLPAYSWGRRSIRFLAREALEWAETRRVA